ncbi:AtpZ/AtpI family protein [Desulfoluna spongiiphila]|uniref:ATP synthase protein I n=1 Tax=Desulfoluna spongiiphila TaxID=419481 RepID=A0A1G5AHI8_9BACT|nr:AtpZ/AtpI family protein [Desulfoluna spongiiphila]SCX77331.1 ATP synthase protein I [Desulfoluna spongiiphila]VVS90582.1 putative f0f1-atpase subunit ca2+/mg2+ transporter [Desulfoluna spongiiphila]
MNKEIAQILKELSYYSSLGLQVAISILLGVGFGIFLDRFFGTTPVLMLIFLVLGIAAAFRNLLLAVKRSKKL